MFRTKLFDLYLCQCIFCIQAIPISLHPFFHPMHLAYSLQVVRSWSYNHNFHGDISSLNPRGTITFWSEFLICILPVLIFILRIWQDWDMTDTPSPTSTFNIAFFCQFCVRDYFLANLSTFSYDFFCALASQARAAASVCTFRRRAMYIRRMNVICISNPYYSYYHCR